ncbi:MAG: 5'-nucleotidase C-terminal domain-containing protein, partial [Propionibacteriaceae bacterium]|nr:5'-nucleotidase C-terminal domain-containing protein [Propionibacteriaceae bacterium]
LGRLVGNALRDTLQAIDADVDFGVVNPGGLRADLSYAAHDGDITFEQLLSVLPFNNNLSIVSLTGRQVTEMLAEQWQRDADGNLPTRPYLELGLSDDVAYAYTETAETCTAAAAGNASVPCQKGSIINVTLRGEPIDPEAVYKIATFNFLAAGGDNFWVFQEASKVVDTGLLDWEGWVDYIRAASADGPIQPDYSRSSVRLEGLPDTLTSVDQVTLQVSKLNVMSLGAVGARQLDVSLGGVDLGRFPVVDGAATVSFTPPEEAAGWPVLAFSAQPNGTYVSFPVRFSAAPVTPVVPALVLSAETVAAGETLTLQVTGGTAGEAVEAWLGADGPLIAEGVLDAAGAADLAAVIPADTAPGDYDVEVTGADGLLLRAGLTVTAAPADADALPASGSSTPLPLLWAALAALAIGAGCGVGSHATRRAGAATRH